MSAHIEQTREWEYISADGIPLFIRDWPGPSAGSPQDQGVLILHGIGEHCGRYAHLARFFNRLGFSVRTYDHRGHGQSGGRRGEVPDSQRILQDAQAVLQEFRSHLGSDPLLFGHSMGGLFAARLATGNLVKIRALILSSPALAIRMSRAQQLLAAVALRLFPGVPVPNGLHTRYLSHDAEVVRAYENDALVHGGISARLLHCMLDAMQDSHAQAASLKIPVLLQFAGDDHLVDPAGSLRFASQLPASLLTMHQYAGMYHEIYNELDASTVFDDLRSWLELHQFTPAELR